jgi:hypothetical protein
MRPYLFKFSALMLPACFLLAFASCVTLCSEHAFERSESSYETVDIPNGLAPFEEECCPLGVTDRALLSERSKVKITDTNADMNETIVSASRLMVLPVQYSRGQTLPHFIPESPPHLRI